MNKKIIIISSICLLLTACATIKTYVDAVKDVFQDLLTAYDTPAGSLVANLPGISEGVLACKSDIAITQMAEDPNTIAWINTLIVAITSGGTVILPPPTTSVVKVN